MKKIFVLFILLSTLSFAKMVDAKVIAVLGGDSFQVLIGKEKVIVNLQGIQPPENKWSPNSKQYLNQMIMNKNVKLDVKSKNKGKMTAVVFVNNQNINMNMIQSGNGKYIGKEKKYVEMQNKAKKNKKGFWMDENAKPLEEKEGPKDGPGKKH